jgi:hypothetical protein
LTCNFAIEIDGLLYFSKIALENRETLTGVKCEKHTELWVENGKEDVPVEFGSKGQVHWTTK